MTPRKKKGGGDWLDALAAQKLEVEAASDALQVKGWLDTGNYALNWAISGRLLLGYPLGHTLEIFGDPATGKSYLITRAIAMAQERGGVALLDDTEGAYNLEHIGTLGVDVQRLAYRRSPTVQEHTRTARAFIGAYREMGLDAPGVLAVDSLSQLSTEHELEEPDKRDMTKAAEIKRFFRVMGPEMMKLPVIHFSTSHVIANIGNFFNDRTTPGGGGPKYASSVRLDLRTVSRIKAGADYVGVIVTVVVDKNRLSTPWRKVQMAIPFDRPISRASGLLPLLIAFGVVTDSGANLTYKGAALGRSFKGKEHFLDMDETAERMLDQYPEILEGTDALLAAAAEQKPAPLAAAEPGPEEAE